MNKTTLYIARVFLILGFAPIASLLIGAVGLVIWGVVLFLSGNDCNACLSLLFPLKFFGNFPLPYVLLTTFTLLIIGFVFLYVYGQKKKRNIVIK